MSRKQPEPARYYIVQNKANPEVCCLVEANKPTQALTYYAQEHFTARIATTREAVNMLEDGFPVVRWNKKPEQLDIEDVAGLSNRATLGEQPDGSFVVDLHTGEPNPVQAAAPADQVVSGENTLAPAGAVSGGARAGQEVRPLADQPKIKPQRRRLMASEVFGKLGGSSDE